LNSILQNKARNKLLTYSRKHEPFSWWT